MRELIPGVNVTDINDIDSKSRREFVKKALSGSALMLLVYAPGAAALHGRGTGWKQMSTEHRYAYVIDIHACIGWGGCIRACKQENHVPDNMFRTWLERYVITEDGEVYVDSPDGGLNGFPPLNDEIQSKTSISFFVPKMCNHCEHPPCVQVCPVGATFKSPEGFVLIDHAHCIGCAYCVQACPYGARFYNTEIGKSDKCSWCYHRVQDGKSPVCVEACPTGARKFGDLLDPDSDVAKILAGRQWAVLKPEVFTSPTCFYISLPHEVV